MYLHSEVENFQKERWFQDQQVQSVSKQKKNISQ